MHVDKHDPRWEDLMEALEDAEPVSTSNWRHGTTNTYVIKLDGGHWRTSVNVHHSEGWELDYGLDFEEVEPVEVTVTKWRRKK